MLYPVKFDSTTNNIQIFTSGEFNSLTQHVLEYIANNDGPGSLSTSSSGNATLIGTFVDTYSTKNTTSGFVEILSTSTTLYQNLNTPTGDEPPRLLVYDTNRGALRRMADSEITTMASNILNYMVVSEGPGSYQIGTSTPAGGTWVNLGLFEFDNLSASDVAANYYLYKKQSSGSYTLERPLKVTSASSTVSAQKLTNTEINLIAKKVRELIVNTGVGQYLLQETTPTPGTWVEKGTIVNTRYPVTSASYEGPVFSTDYSAAVDYEGTGTVQYDGVDLNTNISYVKDSNSPAYEGTSGSFSSTYEGGSYSGNPITSYAGTGPVNFDQGIAEDFFGGYSGTTAFAGYESSYTSTTGGTFVGTYTGPAPGVYFVGFISGIEPGPPEAFSDYYVQVSFYEGLIFGRYDTAVDPWDFAGPLSQYQGPSYTGTGPPVEYFSAVNYQADTNFVGSYDSIVDGPSYQNVFGGYQGLAPGSTTFELAYEGAGAINYIGESEFTTTYGSTYESENTTNVTSTVTTLKLWRRIQ